MSPEGYKEVEHIFKGITEDKLDPKATPQENLESLRADFVRLGINIDPSSNIANSTLKKLIETVNQALSPDRGFPPEVEILLRGAELNESGERISSDLIESREKKDLCIQIASGVTVGENVTFMTSVSIGEQTNIEDNVAIGTGVSIGKHCSVGRGTFLNHDCSIGDNVLIEALTVFEPKTQVPANSRVTHESDDSLIAKIERRLQIV